MNAHPNRPVCANEACYYVPLGNYTANRFDVVPVAPPLSEAIAYRDVYYSPSDYTSLARPVKSENRHLNYLSIHNAYETCSPSGCNYLSCFQCAQGNPCKNG